MYMYNVYTIVYLYTLCIQNLRKVVYILYKDWKHPVANINNYKPKIENTYQDISGDDKS